ncbi:MAG TPA: adenylate cyclase regulatory domain-containing protein, partial [Solirubrobacteraceae bacterium]|nr:adenylate cyclase regulatory domain-containing protein [Solirubrobacteraceae bacterium]
MTLTEAAQRVGVTPATLRRWIRQGLIPQYEGDWTPPAIGHARVVAKMRERGHSLDDIKTASEEGRLAFGFLDELFGSEPQRYTLTEAAHRTGLEAALVKRLIAGLGVNSQSADTVSEDELQLLRYIAAVLDAGFPLAALLQLVRVYGQAIARIADAEVRLFHLYVHEPLMRSGVTGVETAEQMQSMSRQVLPLAGPILDQIHQRYLQFFVEQDVVGHMESDLDGTAVDLGRMRVAIAFADLTGYTRMTEEEGELSAVDAVERFVEAVEVTLPDEARIIKTIGDEAMIIGSDAAALTDWAVGFQAMQTERPLPRIAVHCGVALFRDGDYYGRDINIASRVSARSA